MEPLKLKNINQNKSPFIESDTHYLKPKDVAIHLNISTDKVYALINSGKLEAYNFGLAHKKSYRIDQKQLNQFLQNSTYSSNCPQTTIVNNKINRDSPSQHSQHSQLTQSNTTLKTISKQSILDKLENQSSKKNAVV